MIRSLTLAACVAGSLLAAQAVDAQTRPNQSPPRPASSAAQPQVDDATRTFRAWDKNGDGQLSMAEFSEGFNRARTAAVAEARLRRQFATLDANHNGAIDSNEYANLVLIKNAGRNAPPLSRFDTNGNGKLEFNEYVKLVEALAPNTQPLQPAAGQGRR